MDREYTKEQRRDDLEYIQKLKGEVNGLYRRFFQLNVGGRFHAFLEWCGVIGEHLNICEDIINGGVPAFEMNRHTGETPPIPGYRLTYMAEKMECIFDGLLTVQATKGDEAKASKPVSKPKKHDRAYDAIGDLSNLPRFGQTQRSLDEQLMDLSVVANRLGLYDAADHLRNKL